MVTLNHDSKRLANSGRSELWSPGGKDSDSLGFYPPGTNQRPLSLKTVTLNHGSKRLANRGRSDPPSPDRRTLESLGFDPLGSDPRTYGSQDHRMKRLAKDWSPPLPLPNIHQSLPPTPSPHGVSIFDPHFLPGPESGLTRPRRRRCPQPHRPSSQKTKDTFSSTVPQLTKPLDFPPKVAAL